MSKSDPRRAGETLDAAVETGARAGAAEKLEDREVVARLALALPDQEPGAERALRILEELERQIDQPPEPCLQGVPARRPGGGPAYLQAAALMVSFPAALRKQVEPTSPPQVRMMAARGLVPAPPRDTVTMMCVLAGDDDEKIRDAAQDALTKLPDKIVQGALREKLHPLILDQLARTFQENDAFLEAILVNQDALDETYAFLAGRLAGQALGIIVENQVRQLRHPPILKALVQNPAVSKADRDRVMDFAVRTGMDEQFKGVAAYAEAQERIKARPLDEAEEERLQEVILQSLPQELLEEEECEPRTAEDQKKETFVQMLAKLTSGQKVALAQKGNKTARMILVKDSNRVVATAAIKTPGINAQEAMLIASNRAVCDDVIRIIAQNAEWTRDYAVKVALINNPKCPLALSMKFLTHLRPADIKALSMNKNVSSTLAQTARNMIKPR